MDTQVRVEGLAELRSRLRQAKDKELNNELKAAHRAAAEIVATAARPLVPTRTGKLLASLRTNASLRSGRVAMGRKSVPYAGPIHFGWASRPNRGRGWRGGPIAPNPFLYDALDRRRESVLEKFREGMDAVAAKVGGT